MGSNLAIVLIAVLLGYFLVSRYILASAPPVPAAQVESVQPGTKLPAIDVGWEKSDKNILLVLSTACKYCTESLPFYKKLSESKAGDTRLIVAFAQDRNEAAQYLATKQVAVDEILEAPPNQFNVRGTPTLLVVDGQGIVQEVWAGKLPPEKENEILARLNGGSSAK
ncbi:MAG: hypothetical protein WKF34_01630 [Pyrinomonadaceae bacterium]